MRSMSSPTSAPAWRLEEVPLTAGVGRHRVGPDVGRSRQALGDERGVVALARGEPLPGLVGVQEVDEVEARSVGRVQRVEELGEVLGADGSDWRSTKSTTSSALVGLTWRRHTSHAPPSNVGSGSSLLAALLLASPPHRSSGHSACRSRRRSPRSSPRAA